MVKLSQRSLFLLVLQLMERKMLLLIRYKLGLTIFLLNNNKFDSEKTYKKILLSMNINL